MPQDGSRWHQALLRYMQIGAANAAMRDLDHHLVGRRPRILDRNHVQGASRLFEYRRAHGSVRSLLQGGA